MLKRLRWLTAGAAVGVGGSLWLQRRLKDAATRYRPAGVAVAAAARARDALDEGRLAMKEREAQLRRRSGPERGAGSVPERDAGSVPERGRGAGLGRSARP